MNYYVIQVKTGGEETYLRSARDAIVDGESKIFWPRRRLRIRKKGRMSDTLAPIFPGYIFLETETLANDTYWALRRSIGFYKFLRNNRDVRALSGKDKELLLHFLRLGEVVEKSKVYFDENNKIRVIEGALKGLEGEVVKVDRRKKRAKVRLSLYEDSFLVDFGFEVMERIDGDRTDEE
jgi:transcriptional antiterminator NusG